MGFSTTHLILGVVFLTMVVGAIILLVVLLKWMLKASQDPKITVAQPQGQAEAEATTAAPPAPPAPITTQRSKGQSFLCGMHFVGGCIGALTLMSNASGRSLGTFDALCWLLMAAQVAAAICGAWKLWQRNPLGLQLLYWVSLSCVPLLSLSALSYWSSFGFGITPYLTLGPSNFGLQFLIRFGYDGNLWINGDASGLSLGINFVALFCFGLARRSLVEQGIGRWPLLLRS